MLKRIEQVMHTELPADMRQHLTISIIFATSMLIRRLSMITGDQNMKLIRSFETKANDAETRAIHTRSKIKAECARAEARAYRSAIEDVVVIINDTDKEFSKVDRIIEEAAQDDLLPIEPKE